MQKCQIEWFDDGEGQNGGKGWFFGVCRGILLNLASSYERLVTLFSSSYPTERQVWLSEDANTHQ